MTEARQPSGPRVRHMGELAGGGAKGPRGTITRDPCTRPLQAPGRFRRSSAGRVTGKGEASAQRRPARPAAAVHTVGGQSRAVQWHLTRGSSPNPQPRPDHGNTSDEPELTGNLQTAASFFKSTEVTRNAEGPPQAGHGRRDREVQRGARGGVRAPRGSRGDSGEVQEGPRSVRAGAAVRDLVLQTHQESPDVNTGGG